MSDKPDSTPHNDPSADHDESIADQPAAGASPDTPDQPSADTPAAQSPAEPDPPMADQPATDPSAAHSPAEPDPTSESDTSTSSDTPDQPATDLSAAHSPAEPDTPDQPPADLLATPDEPGPPVQHVGDEPPIIEATSTPTAPAGQSAGASNPPTEESETWTPVEPPPEERHIPDRVKTIGTAVVISLAVVILLAFGLGYVGVPGEVTSLRQQNNLLQTQVADLEALSDTLDETEALVATIQVEVGIEQDRLEAFATTQADQAERIGGLTERTERVNNFLELLSDIAQEAAAREGTPTAEETSESATPRATEPTQEPTSTSVVTPTPSITDTGE